MNLWKLPSAFVTVEPEDGGVVTEVPIPIKLSKGFADCVFWAEVIWLVEDEPKRFTISFAEFDLGGEVVEIKLSKGFAAGLFCVELDEVVPALKRLIISFFGSDWAAGKLLVVADGSPPKIVAKISAVLWAVSGALFCLTSVTIPSPSRSKSDYKYKQSYN